MLAQELGRYGVATVAASLSEADAAPPETRREVELVCLCILEPTQPAELRAIVRAVRGRARPAKVMLCLWRGDAEALPDDLAARFAIDSVATSLTSAVAAVLRFFRRDNAQPAARAALSPAPRAEDATTPC
jgi:hypothetical protein